MTLITVAEAASILHVDHRTVLDWIASDQLGHGHFADGRLGVRAVVVADDDTGARTSRLTTFSLGNGAPDEELARALRDAQSDLIRAQLPRDDIDLPALAAELARRLTPVAPRRHPIHSRGSWLILDDPDQGEEAIDLVRVATSSEDEPAGRLAGLVGRVVALVQDFMLEATTELWPPSSAGGIASVFARVDGEVVRAGFGSPEAPVWELEPLRAADFLRA